MVNLWSFWQNEAKIINLFNGALWKSPVDFGEKS
jgi:hypothetical protein